MLSAPVSGDWNTATNWSPSAPVNPGDTATFNTSRQTSLTLSASATVDSITFKAEPAAVTINTQGHLLTMQGAGIVNNPGQTQTIINGGEVGGSTTFSNRATAANVTITNNGGFDFRGQNGVTNFFASSNAG